MLPETEQQTAQKADEQARDAKNLFLANMSHEIRTPLNAIVGLTALALDLAEDPAQREYLSMVQSSAEVLLGTISGILDFSKIEANQLTLEDIPFDLHDVIEESLRLLDVQARHKGLGLFSELSFPATIRVHGDPLRLRQILTNLINNSVKFTESGYILLSAGIVGEQQDSITFSFSVKDTGIGIPVEDQEIVFESFKQGGNTKIRKFEGTGLGLAIVKMLVELQGGEIRLESVPGAGTTFFFTIVLRKATPLLVPIPQPLDLPPLGAPMENHVLLISNSDVQKRLLKESFASWGLSFSAAQSEEDAFKKLIKAEQFNFFYRFIILDQNGSTMPGEKFLAYVNDRLNIPIVLLASSPDSRKICASCEKYSIFFCVKKPLALHELKRKIAALLQGERCTFANTVTAKNPIPIPKIPHQEVLLVEDNIFNQKLGKAILEKMGPRVTTASDGLSALQTMCQKRFDIVLMDLQMPVMDGITATSIIRRCERERQPRAREHQDLIATLGSQINGTRTPIVAMTAFDMARDREKCLKAGMDGYLTKPFVPQDIAKAINSCCQ